MRHVGKAVVKTDNIQCQGDQPCEKCVRSGTECLFDQNQDRRRKYILRQTKEELGSAEDLLDKVAQAFSQGDTAQLQLLLSSRLTACVDDSPKRNETGGNQVYLSRPHYSRRYPIVN
jgi:hypothetical protein